MSAELQMSTMGELSRRRYQRVNMAVPVAIGPHLYHTIDWSVQGFGLAVRNDDSGTEAVPATISIPANDLSVTFRVVALPVFCDTANLSCGYQFLNLTEGQHDLLRALVVYQVAGGSFPLDQIVTDPENQEALRKARASKLCQTPGYDIQCY